MPNTTKAQMLQYISQYLGDTDDHLLIPLLRDICEYKTDEIANTYQVDSLEDLPECDEFNVITLESNAVYFFSGIFDLQGCRLHCPGVTVLKGQDSEVTRIKSTGLAAGQYVITARDTLQIIDITIESDPTTYCIDLDGSAAPSGAPVADWFGCNFSGGNIGRVKSYDNFIVQTSAWFPNGSGLLVEGSIGTTAFETSIFVQTTAGETAIEFAADYVAERRIRINNSSLVIGASSFGINLPVTATIPVEAYILNLVNFSGGGTYIQGVQSTDNKARFIECRGSGNSTSLAEVSGTGNVTPTTILATNTDYRAVTNAVLDPISERFSYDPVTGILTYTGALQLKFQVSITATLLSGNNNQVVLKLYKNESPVLTARGVITANGAGRAENVSLTIFIDLSPGDELQVDVANLTATNDITVEDINIVCHEL